MSTAITKIEVISIRDLEVGDVVFFSKSLDGGYIFTQRLIEIPSAEPHRVQSVTELDLDGDPYYSITTGVGSFYYFGERKLMRRFG